MRRNGLLLSPAPSSYVCSLAAPLSLASIGEMALLLPVEFAVNWPLELFSEYVLSGHPGRKRSGLRDYVNRSHWRYVEARSSRYGCDSLVPANDYIE